VLHPGNQGADDAVAVLAANVDQHHKARAKLHHRGNMAVSGTTQQVAFPMARDGAILNFCGSVADRYGIDDLPPRLPRRCRGSAPTHDPAAAQVGQKFLLEHAHFSDQGA
jgi:hypothetical protein